MIFNFKIKKERYFIMDDLTTLIGKFCNILEDAIEEENWRDVKVVLKEMDALYEDLERRSSGFDTDDY
jgi:hypothetical protein